MAATVARETVGVTQCLRYPMTVPKIVLDCEKCGAALEIAADADLFRCAYCNTPYLVTFQEGTLRVRRLEERVARVEAQASASAKAVYEEWETQAAKKLDVELKSIRLWLVCVRYVACFLLVAAVLMVAFPANMLRSGIRGIDYVQPPTIPEISFWATTLTIGGIALWFRSGSWYSTRRRQALETVEASKRARRQELGLD